MRQLSCFIERDASSWSDQTKRQLSSLNTVGRYLTIVNNAKTIQEAGTVSYSIEFECHFSSFFHVLYVDISESVYRNTLSKSIRQYLVQYPEDQQGVRDVYTFSQLK